MLIIALIPDYISSHVMKDSWSGDVIKWTVGQQVEVALITSVARITQ